MQQVRNDIDIIHIPHFHKHYIGAAQSFEIVQPKDPKYDGRPDVTILKTFFIDDTVNANDWQATWEGLKLDAQDLPGTPLVLQEDLEHPTFSVQKYYDRGTIFDYDLDEENHKIIVYVRITDPSITQRIQSGELQYVSPAVIPRGSEYLRKVNGVDVLDRSLPLHLCIVGDPAYGKDKAVMSHICSGDGIACYNRLKTMSAAIVNLAQSDECVSRKIQIIKREKPTISDEQAAAIAYSMCRKGTASQTYSTKFAAEFENLNCKSKYATIKDGTVKVDWSGKQHQLLHTRDLTHSHVCIDKSGEKHITRHGTKKGSVEEYNSVIAEDNERPPKAWWDDCISSVSDTADDPQALCNWIWHNQKGSLADLITKAQEASPNSGIKSDLQLIQADTGIPALEQIPFIKKMIASISRTASILEQTRFGMKYPIHHGREGYWIKAKGMDVFVARNQSLHEALMNQCGCAKIGATEGKISQERANYHKTDSMEKNCKSCKFFNSKEETCQVVEGKIESYYISDLWQPK